MDEFPKKIESKLIALGFEDPVCVRSRPPDRMHFLDVAARFEIGGLALDFFTDHRLEIVHVGWRGMTYQHTYPFENLGVALGWYPVPQEFDLTPRSFDDQLRELAQHRAQVLEAFEPGNLGATLARLEWAYVACGDALDRWLNRPRTVFSGPKEQW